jgi:hypothetical protein
MRRFLSLLACTLLVAIGAAFEAKYISAPAAVRASAAHFFYVAGIIFAIFFSNE